MAQLSYKGAALSDTQDVAYLPYPTTLKNTDLTPTQVGALIDAKLNTYPSAATIQALDSLLVDTAFVDAEDAKRMVKELRGAPSGIAPLDNTGKVPVSFFPVASTQSWNDLPVIPITYNLDPILYQDGDPSTSLYVCNIPDPGYPYRLLVWGQCDATSTSDYYYPVVNVRLNSNVGTIIAQGTGAADGVVNLQMGDDFNRDDNNTLGENWNVTYVGAGSGATMAIRDNEASLLQAMAPLNKTRAAVCQRVDPSTRYTGTNFQKVTFKTGTRAGSPLIDTPNQGNPYFRMYMRANDAFTQYVAWEVGNNEARLVYNTGSGEKYFSQVEPITKMFEWEADTRWWGFAGGDMNNVSERLFSLYKDTYAGPVKVMEVVDSGFYTALGPGNRGWGFGLQNTLFLLGQAMSPTVEYVYATDMAWPYEPVSIMPYQPGRVTLNGDNTLWVQVENGDPIPPPQDLGFDDDPTQANALAFSSYRPRLMAMVVPIT